MTKDKVKVMYIALFYDYGKPLQGESYEEFNFHYSLREMSNIDVIHLATDKAFIKGGRDEISKQFRNLIDTQNIDVVFEVPFREEYSPTAEDLRYARDNGVICVEWDCDSSWRFDKFIKGRLSRYDYFVTTHSEAVQWYKNAGANVIKSQWGGSPFFHKMDIPKKYDITFIGLNHSNRWDIIKQIRNAGININVWGHNWVNSDFTHGRVTYSQVNKIFNESKICLNMSNASAGKLDQIKGRHFELPMTGSFQLTSVADNIKDYFVKDEEIIIYKDITNMIDKIKYYLANDEEREKIAIAGMNRCLKDHTWENRIMDIFSSIGAM